MKILRAKNNDWIRLGYTFLNNTYHHFWINKNGELIESYGIWL